MSPADPRLPGADEPTVVMPRHGAPRPAAAASDATLIVPAKRQRSEIPPAHAPTETASPNIQQLVGSVIGKRNRLLAAASPLLTLAAHLRGLATHADPVGLQARVVEEIKAFEAAATAGGINGETVMVARYILCCTLDEAALATPWGSQSAWSTQSLLALFHNETWGGEKFFTLLERMQVLAARHIDLLEVFYACLAIGFQGRYRVLTNGGHQLDQLRSELFRTIREQRGLPSVPPPLSRAVAPAQGGSRLRFYPPVWVAFAVAALALTSIYYVIDGRYDSRVAQTIDRLAAIAPRSTP
ncbi:MAG TPA: type IVB secretion system protein IcmH/DotU [Stellaceae bacterium]|nr:type IVB secretion system protein IcmH/DotU [Stellaceae bacterium]